MFRQSPPPSCEPQVNASTTSRPMPTTRPASLNRARRFCCGSSSSAVMSSCMEAGRFVGSTRRPLSTTAATHAGTGDGSGGGLTSPWRCASQRSLMPSPGNAGRWYSAS